MSEPNDAVRALADHYALTMPDEYPYGFAVYMAEIALLDKEVVDLESDA
jgi:hypothetical protein